MKINAISNGYENRNQASNPSFNGLWMRFGRYRTGLYGETKYAWAGFIPCKDGVKLTNTVDPVKDRNMMELTPCDLTVKDCENAVGALFKNQKDEAGYNSLLKLRTFIKSIMAPDGHHNVLFIEDKDVADVNKTKHQVTYNLVQDTINSIGKKLGYAKNEGTALASKQIEAEALKFPEDPAELAEYLRLNGIA